MTRSHSVHSPRTNVSPETHRPQSHTSESPAPDHRDPFALSSSSIQLHPIVITLDEDDATLNRSVSSDGMPRCPTYPRSYNRTSPDERKQISGFDFRGSDSARHVDHQLRRSSTCANIHCSVKIVLHNERNVTAYFWSRNRLMVRSNKQSMAGRRTYMFDRVMGEPDRDRSATSHECAGSAPSAASTSTFIQCPIAP